MSEYDVNNRDAIRKHMSRTQQPLLLSEAEFEDDFRQLPMIYRETMDRVLQVLQTEIAFKFDRADNHPDVSALFYKGAIKELVRAAIGSVGDQKARSILRSISNEIRL